MYVGGEPVCLAGVVGSRARLAPMSRLVPSPISLRRAIRPYWLDVPQGLRTLLRDREHRTRGVCDQVGWIEPVQLLGSIPFLDLELKRVGVERTPGSGL